jgi:quercetin dioxygenase-like cupin family protein
MKTLRFSTILIAFCATAAFGQHAGHHQAVRASDLKWSPVPSLPKGAQIAVIEGSMAQAVPFTVRIKFPAHYALPAHTHPAVERVTVLSGTFHMGMGEKFDRAAMQPVPAGDMMIMQPGTVHFAWTDAETVVQLHGTGPWGVNYVNPNDDPRKQ